MVKLDASLALHFAVLFCPEFPRFGLTAGGALVLFQPSNGGGSLFWRWSWVGDDWGCGVWEGEWFCCRVLTSDGLSGGLSSFLLLFVPVLTVVQVVLWW